MESHWLLPSHALHRAWVPYIAQTPSKYFQEPPEGVSPLLKISSLLLGMVVSLLRFVALPFQYSCSSGLWAGQAHRYFGNWKRLNAVTANHSSILKLSYSFLSAQTSHFFFCSGSLFFRKTWKSLQCRQTLLTFRCHNYSVGHWLFLGDSTNIL